MRTKTRTPAARTPVSSTGIRSGYYTATDGYHGLAAAVAREPATCADPAVKKALEDLRKALDAVNASLAPYAWD